MTADLLPRMLLLVGGFGALYFGAEWLVYGSANLARRLGVPAIVIGLTIVSLGTSAPELAVSLTAALQGQTDIALGNVLGSNLANVGLVLGITAFVRPLVVGARVIQREVPIMAVITVLVFPIAMDGEISRGDGLILTALLVAYLGFVFRASGEEPPEVKGVFTDFIDEGSPAAVPVSALKAVGLVVLGAGTLVLGGFTIVQAATYVARVLGVPDLIIGLTVIAIGTSLPELATSVVATVRKEADIAVGNVIGSNVFNLGAVLGITAIAHPVPVSSDVLSVELPAVLLISLLVIPFARTQSTIGRLEGAFLVLAYAGLTTWIMASIP